MSSGKRGKLNRRDAEATGSSSAPETMGNDQIWTMDPMPRGEAMQR
jgi:hypothetical protein